MNLTRGNIVRMQTAENWLWLDLRTLGHGNKLLGSKKTKSFLTTSATFNSLELYSMEFAIAFNSQISLQNIPSNVMTVIQR
jgi:hypothetical protein